MSNKSYKEICNTCELIEFNDLSSGIYEHYVDDTKGYVCYWFPGSTSELPATIKTYYL